MAIGYKLCDKWFHGFYIKAKPSDYTVRKTVFTVFTGYVANVTLND